MGRKIWVAAVIFFMGMGRGWAGAPTDSAALYFQKADSCVQKRNARLAQFYFDQSLRLNPNNEEARLAYARLLTTRNQYKESRKQLEAVFAQNPKNMSALSALFADACQHHLWDDAIKYGSLLQVRSPSDSVDRGMAKAYYQTEDYGKAGSLLLQITAKHPAAADYLLLAKCQVELSDYKQASAAYKKCLAMDTANADVWYEYGLLLSAVPNYAAAIEALQKAMQYGIKQDMVFLENLSTLYLQTSDFEKGIALIDALLVKRPKDDDLMFLAAQAYYKAKKYKPAVDYYEKAYLADPENYRALYMMGMSLQKDGKNKKGEDLCNEAIAKDPSLEKYRMQTQF